MTTHFRKVYTYSHKTDGISDNYDKGQTQIKLNTLTQYMFQNKKYISLDS